MARTLRASFTLIALSLCSLAFASRGAYPRFQVRSFTNSSTQTSTLSSPPTSSSTSSITTTTTSSSTSSSTTTTTNSTDPSSSQTTTITQGNTTIVGLSGPTITAAPNFDLSGLDALDPALYSYVVAHGLYSVDWADFLSFSNGSLVFQPTTASNTTACPTFWVFSQQDDGDNGGDGVTTEFVTVVAQAPTFCQTDTFTPPETTITEAFSTAESTVSESLSETHGPPISKVSVIVYVPPTTTVDFSKPTAVGVSASVNYGSSSEAAPAGKTAPASNKGNSGSSAVDSIVSAGIASAIAQVFPGSSPSKGSPDQPKNSGSPSGNNAPEIISNLLGAYIASALAGGPPGNNNPPPQQGQVNGISYSVGPTAIVLDGKTYPPGVPTVVTLPNGHTANIGPTGISIDNNFVPVNPSNTGSSPSQSVINGVPYSLTPNGIVISGTTYSTSQPTSVTLPNGQTLVIGANGIAQIGGTAIPAPTSGSFNGISYTIVPGGSIVIDGQTISPSSPTSITLPDGHVVSIGPSGLIIDGTSVPVTLGLGTSTGTSLGLGIATPTTTSHSGSSGTTSSTGSSTTASSKATTTGASRTTTTAASKNAAAYGNGDLLPLGTPLIVGLWSVLIAWL